MRPEITNKPCPWDGAVAKAIAQWDKVRRAPLKAPVWVTP